MTVLILEPISSGGSSSALSTMNPPMSYDMTLGTPTAQGIVPPFTNMAATIYEITGSGAAYVWNTNLGIWN